MLGGRGTSAQEAPAAYGRPSSFLSDDPGLRTWKLRMQEGLDDMQRRLAGVSALGARNNELASEGFKDEVQALPVAPRHQNGMAIGPGAVGPSK